MKKWAFIQSQYINNLLKTQEDLHAILAHRNKIHDRKQTLKGNKHLPEYVYLFLNFLLHLFHIQDWLLVMWRNSALCKYSVKNTKSICEQSMEATCMVVKEWLKDWLCGKR